MKKVFYLLLAFSLLGFASCSSDNKEDDVTPPKPDPEYFNPIEGEWLEEKQNNTLKAIFTNDFYWEHEWFENGKWGNNKISGRYKIDKKYITINKSSLEYKLDGDNLSIYYPSTSKWVKYTRYKE